MGTLVGVFLVDMISRRDVEREIDKFSTLFVRTINHAPSGAIMKKDTFDDVKFGYKSEIVNEMQTHIL